MLTSSSQPRGMSVLCGLLAMLTAVQVLSVTGADAATVSLPPNATVNQGPHYGGGSLLQGPEGGDLVLVLADSGDRTSPCTVQAVNTTTQEVVWTKSEGLSRDRHGRGSAKYHCPLTLVAQTPTYFLVNSGGYTFAWAFKKDGSGVAFLDTKSFCETTLTPTFAVDPETDKYLFATDGSNCVVKPTLSWNVGHAGSSWSSLAYTVNLVGDTFTYDTQTKSLYFETQDHLLVKQTTAGFGSYREPEEGGPREIIGRTNVTLLKSLNGDNNPVRQWNKGNVVAAYGNLYVGNAQYLFCLDQETLAVKWVAPVKGLPSGFDAWDSPAAAKYKTPIALGGFVFVLGTGSSCCSPSLDSVSVFHANYDWVPSPNGTGTTREGATITSGENLEYSNPIPWVSSPIHTSTFAEGTTEIKEQNLHHVFPSGLLAVINATTTTVVQLDESLTTTATANAVPAAGATCNSIAAVAPLGLWLTCQMRNTTITQTETNYFAQQVSFAQGEADFAMETVPLGPRPVSELGHRDRYRQGVFVNPDATIAHIVDVKKTNYDDWTSALKITSCPASTVAAANVPPSKVGQGVPSNSTVIDWLAPNDETAVKKEHDSPNKKRRMKILIGCLVGLVVLILVVIVVGVCLRQKSNNNKKDDHSSTQYSTLDNSRV